MARVKFTATELQEMARALGGTKVELGKDPGTGQPIDKIVPDTADVPAHMHQEADIIRRPAVRK